jgi:hypothetical protein
MQDCHVEKSTGNAVKRKSQNKRGERLEASAFREGRKSFNRGPSVIEHGIPDIRNLVAGQRDDLVYFLILDEIDRSDDDKNKNNTSRSRPLLTGPSSDVLLATRGLALSGFRNITNALFRTTPKGQVPMRSYCKLSMASRYPAVKTKHRLRLRQAVRANYYETERCCLFPSIAKQRVRTTGCGGRIRSTVMRPIIGPLLLNEKNGEVK